MILAVNIPGQDSENIEFSFDVSKLKSGTNNTYLELVNTKTKKTVGVIPVNLTVNSKTGSVKSTLQLLKQTNNEQQPVKFELSQNYPNPFNPSTTINYDIPETGHVTLIIYNTLGEKVKTLIDDVKSSGKYSVKFDASELAGGIYFYRMQTNNNVSVKKLILLK
jgi:hypothetical protein